MPAELPPTLPSSTTSSRKIPPRVWPLFPRPTLRRRVGAEIQLTAASQQPRRRHRRGRRAMAGARAGGAGVCGTRALQAPGPQRGPAHRRGVVSEGQWRAASLGRAGLPAPGGAPGAWRVWDFPRIFPDSVSPGVRTRWERGVRGAPGLQRPRWGQEGAAGFPGGAVGAGAGRHREDAHGSSPAASGNPSRTESVPAAAGEAEGSPPSASPKNGKATAGVWEGGLGRRFKEEFLS